MNFDNGATSASVVHDKSSSSTLAKTVTGLGEYGASFITVVQKTFKGDDTQSHSVLSSSRVLAGVDRQSDVARSRLPVSSTMTRRRVGPVQGSGVPVEHHR